MIELWMVLVLICAGLSITHPTKQGTGICGVFMLGVLIPEILRAYFSIPVQHMYLIFTMAAFTVVMVLCHLNPSRLRDWIIGLSIAEGILNLFGLYDWYNYLYIYLSNYIDKLSGISIVGILGENWIYNIGVILFYCLAIIILFDRKGRAENVGNRVLQYFGDTMFSGFIRFKDVEECSEQRKK